MAGYESSFEITDHLPRGAEVEQEVCKWLRLRGYRIALRRFRTPYAEIDIIALNSSNEVLIVEVKSRLWPEDCSENLSARQRLRLIRAAHWVREELFGTWHRELPSDVTVEIALVVPTEDFGLQSLPKATRCASFRMIAIF